MSAAISPGAAAATSGVERWPVTLLDGGMGQELTRRAKGPLHPLWSAMVMLQEPQLVRELHVEFIRNGSRVITTNAYSVTRDRLERYGLEGEFLPLQRRAVALAREAREEAGIAGVRIAGCIPPLKWSYRWQEVDPADETEPIYRELAETQADGVDLLLCETMASGEQALGAVRGAMSPGLPVWVSWTVQDSGTGHLRSGETLAEADACLAGLPVAARLVNCAPPEAVDAAIPGLAALGGVWGAYANGFATIPDGYAPGMTVDDLSARGEISPTVYAGHTLRWAEEGAAIIGGCCEIGPAHIAAVAKVLASRERQAPEGARWQDNLSEIAS